MAIPVVLVLLASLGAMLYFIFKKSEIDIFLEAFPGPTTFPFIGNIWCLWKSEDRLPNLIALQRKYGNRVPVKGRPLKILSLFHPDDVGKVLTCKDSNKSWFYDVTFKHWLDSSLFIAKAKEHATKRKIVQPLFVFKNVDKSEISFNESSKTLVKMFRADAIEGKETQVRWIFPLFSLDVMYQYFGNINPGFLTRLDRTQAHAYHEEIKCGFERSWSPWLWPDLLWRISPTGRRERASRKILQDFFTKLVRDCKIKLFSVDSNMTLPLQEADLKQPEKLIPLDWLVLEENRGRSGMTEKYIKEESTGAIFAGHDTTSSALIFSLYLLASHPKEQDKLHLELEEVFGDDKERDVHFSDLPKLKFLECCIKEVLRMYPPAPMMFRDSPTCFQLDKETTIPKGVDIFLSPWVTHRLPEFWPEPEEFKPSRFFSENSLGRHPYSYIPFSAGPRNCAGQKLALAVLKTALAHIFRNFNVELSRDAEPVVPIGDIVVLPKDGLKVRFKLR